MSVRQNRIHRSRHAIALAVGSYVALSATWTHAATYYYDGPTNDSLNSPNNWSTSNTAPAVPANVVPGSGDLAVLGMGDTTTGYPGGGNLYLNGNLSFSGLQFGGPQYTAALGGITIDSDPANTTGGTGANSLTIGAAGINQSTHAGQETINANLILAQSESWVNTAAPVQISGNISGAFDLTLASGQWNLLGTNSFNNLTINNTLNANGTGLNASDSAHSISFTQGTTFGVQSNFTTAKPVNITGNTNWYLNGFNANFNGATSGGTISLLAGKTLGLGGTVDNPGLGAVVANGTLLLNKTNSSPSVHAIEGKLTVNAAGIVQLGGTGGDQIPDAANVTLNGTLDMNGASEAFDQITGTGTITNTLASTVGVLTLGANNSSSTLSSVFKDGAGQVGLSKSGSGTITVSGNNTYSGPTSVSAGTLIVSPTSSLGNGTTAVTVSNSGTLRFSNSGNQAVALPTAAAAYASSSNFRNTPNYISGTPAGGFQVGANGGGASQPDFVLVDLGANYALNTITLNLPGDAVNFDSSQFYIANSSVGSFSSLYNGSSSSGTAVTPNTVNLGSFTVDSAYNKDGTGSGAAGAYTYALNGVTGEYLLIYSDHREAGVNGGPNFYGLNFNSVTVSQLFVGSATTQTIGSLASASQTSSVILDANLTLNTGGNNAPATTFAGTIVGNGALNKVGTGAFTVTNANTYAGGTTVTAGTMYVNNTTGSGTGSGSVSVNGGTLRGTGTISGGVSLAGGATLSPGIGNAANTLKAASVTSTGTNAGSPSTASNFSFNINSNTLTNDELITTGAVSLGSCSLLSVADLGNSTLTSQTFVLINAAGGVTGTFANFADNSTYTVGPNTYTVSYDTTNEVTLSVNSAPEPGMLGMLGLGGLAMMRRRRKTLAGEMLKA